MRKRDIEVCERLIRAQRLGLDGHTLTIDRSTERSRSERSHEGICSCGRWDESSSKLWDVRRMFRNHLQREIEVFNLRVFAERVAERFRRVAVSVRPVGGVLDWSGGDAIIHWQMNVTVDGGRGMMPFPSIAEGSTEEEVLGRFRVPPTVRQWGEYGWDHLCVVSPVEMQPGVPEQRAFFGIFDLVGAGKDPKAGELGLKSVRDALVRAGVVVG